MLLRFYSRHGKQKEEVAEERQDCQSHVDRKENGVADESDFSLSFHGNIRHEACQIRKWAAVIG